MLYLVVLLSMIAVAYGGTDGRPKIHLPKAVLDVVNQAKLDCLKEKGLSNEIGEKFFKLEFTPDADMKTFAYCLARKTNYCDDDGHFSENLITLFGDHKSKDEIQNVIDKCNKIKKDTSMDTFFDVIVCFFKDSPVLVVP
ncbi:B1 protein-like [Battus philenor]|uniref:B1 protein-like n=1 Tax=Battus philenor TaxID=42288 RepID=UPI0035CFEAED